MTEKVPATTQGAAWLEVLEQLFEKYPPYTPESKARDYGWGEHTGILIKDMPVLWRQRAIENAQFDVHDTSLAMAMDTGVPNEELEAAYALIFG